MASNWDAIRENRERGHVAILRNRYCPGERKLPAAAIAREPWMCVFHDEAGGPKPFIAFGGRSGVAGVVEAELGALVPNVEFSGGAPLHGAASAGTEGSTS